MLKKLRNKKGFTLIEIVVVLAIMAILAAAAIPTMNGILNDAKDQTHMAEARSVYVAAQYLAVKDQATPTTAKVADVAGVASSSVTAVTMDTTDTTKVNSVTCSFGGKTYTVTAGDKVVVS